MTVRRSGRRGAPARRVVGRERGSASIEMVGALPIIVVVVLVLFQVCAVVYATQAANQAVRDGARAMSLGRSVDAAVDASLPGGLTAQRITYPGDGAVRLELRAPGLAFLPEVVIERTAVMP